MITLRHELRTTSDLGDYGAAEIHRTLCERGAPEVPATRTIHRILERRGALDGQRRIHRPAPPPGWYLPDVAAGRAELDVGLPTYAQFDNDTRFQGPHQHRDGVSRVMRLCLSLGVTPVFAPVREHGFQNAIENLNGRWQAKVWSRFHHESLAALCARSERFVRATRGWRAWATRSLSIRSGRIDWSAARSTSMLVACSAIASDADNRRTNPSSASTLMPCHDDALKSDLDHVAVAKRSPLK